MCPVTTPKPPTCFTCGGPILRPEMAMVLLFPHDPDCNAVSPIGAVHKGTCLDVAEAATEYVLGTEEMATSVPFALPGLASKPAESFNI